MSKKERLRPLALCVFQRGEMIFVGKNFDESKQSIFYRPLGGGIEFGEYAIETVAREIREEINAEVRDLVYIGTLENIFEYNGAMGHEIVLLYDGAFVDEERNRDGYSVEGNDNGDYLFLAEWKPLRYFREGHAPLYPTGLLDLLEKCLK